MISPARRGTLDDYLAADDIVTIPAVAEHEWDSIRRQAGWQLTRRFCTVRNLLVHGVRFLHRFGSALNHHVHLHVCATEGVFVPPADGAGCDTPPAFLPGRPINQADLAALTERVRRRVIRFLQAHSPARHRCRRRHAHVGEQRFFSRCQCSDHAQ